MVGISSTRTFLVLNHIAMQIKSMHQVMNCLKYILESNLNRRINYSVYQNTYAPLRGASLRFTG